MEIKTVEQIEEIRHIIGDQNADGCKRLLADKGRMWFFRSVEESQVCTLLNDWERGFCAGRFDAGATWAGIVRLPHRLRECIWEIDLCGEYDSHGNYRGGGSGNRGGYDGGIH